MEFSPRDGSLSTYSDDTYGARTPAFMTEIDKLMRNIRTHRSDEKNVRFAGLLITKTEEGIMTDGNNYLARIPHVSTPAGAA